MAYIGTHKISKKMPARWRNRLSTNARQIWNYEKSDTVRVLCYTNCQEAELLLNAKMIGERKSYDDKTGIISWEIQYEPGELRVVAFNDGQEAANDPIITNMMPAALKAEVLEDKDDSLIRQVLVRVVDSKGNHIPLADNEIRCRVSGGILLGMENASSDVSENYLDNKQRSKNGQMMIYLKKDSFYKPMVVRLSSSLLQSLIIDVE